MARTQQDILVKIKVLLEGLGNVRALAGHVKDLNGGSGQTAALAGNIDRLAGAVDRLANASGKTQKTGGSFVRFLVGVSAVVSTLSNIPQAFQGISKLLDLADNLGGGLSSLFGKLTGLFQRGGAAASSALSSVGSSLSGLVSGAGASASGALAGIGGALAGLAPFALAAAAALAVVVGVVAAAVAGFLSLAASVGVGAVALTFIAQRGLEVQRSLEQVRLGIAAIITSLADVKVDGLPVEGAEKFRAAMAVSADQLKKLQVDAVNTVATFEQIAPAFQTAIGPGLAAKLTLDEIRGITVKVVQAASAIGLPLNQVSQEVRAILEGTINEDARLAKVLGISNEMVKSWKAQGKLAEELNKRLAGFAVAGVEAAETMDGLTSNLQEALNVFSAEATVRAFDALKGEFKRLLPQLFDFKSAGISAQFKGLAELADEVLVRVVRIAGGIAQNIVSGLRQASAFIDRNRSQIDAVLTQVEILIRLLIQGVGVVAQIATSSATWGSTLGVVQGVLGLINSILVLILDQFKQMAPYLQLAILAANLLIASQPALAAFANAAAGPRGSGVNQQDLDNETQRLRDKQSGRRITVTASPRAPSAGKGARAKKRDQLGDLTAAAEDAALGTDRARVERAFNLTRDFLERQSQLIEQNLEERRTSIERYYADEERIQREAIDAEVNKLNELFALEEKDLARKKARIDADPDKDLSAAEREKKKQAAEQEFKQKTIPIVERLTILERERLDLAGQIARKRREELQAFEQMLNDVDEQLALETGDIGGAIEAARRGLDAANKERLERIAAQKGADSTEYQQAVQLVEVLKKKAEYQLLFNQLRQQQDSLALAEDNIRRRVERGTISELEGRKQVVAAQLKHKDAVAETLEKMRQLANESGVAELIINADRATAETEELGRQIDDTARRINDSLRSGLEQTFSDIITRTKSVKEAFSDLARHILSLIAQILAQKFVEKLFGSLLSDKDEDEDYGGGGFNLGSAVSKFFGSIFGRATGSFEGATPGGRIVRVAEGGFDEVILTTDPRHKGRTSRLLGEFLRRTGLAPDFGAAVLAGATGGIPSFATGGFALSDVEPPDNTAGDVGSLRVEAHFHGVKDVASFQQNEAAIKRTIGRAAQDGIRRAKSRPRN
jgi:hypothetical protein